MPIIANIRYDYRRKCANKSDMQSFTPKAVLCNNSIFRRLAKKTIPSVCLTADSPPRLRAAHTGQLHSKQETTPFVMKQVK